MYRKMEVVMLTKHHIELIGSKEHFQLKWDSTKRILSLFDAIGDEYENNDTLFDMIKHARDGSIRTTRGEDHYGFPYILLDVPCAISKQRIFLIRVMCWFGNGLYCSLIVKDSRDEMRACMELMKNHIDVLVENELWVSLTDCWAYWDRELITRDNFESALSRVCENGFFKIGMSHSLNIFESEIKVRFEVQRFINLVCRVGLAAWLNR